MSEAPPRLPAPLYQGSVNTWECDDGGHLNVRFHFERAMIGFGHFANALGMPHANVANSGATLLPLEAHIRFLREARPGAPLSMHGGVVAFEEDSATLCLDMRHADGSPSSCFTFKVAHIETRELRPFPWTKRARAAAEALKCEAPEHSKPRSFDLSKAPSDISRAKAIEVGAQRIGGAMVTPDQCDAFGRLRLEHFVGRISDSVPNLLAQWRHEAGSEAGATPAGAVVEARVIYRRFPRAGELIEVHSGIAEVGEKTMRLAHWIVDPESGKPWASMEAVALTFDTTTRKAISPSPEARKRMQARVVKMSA